MNVQILLTFAAYIAVLFGIGFLYYKSSNNENSFALGDRSLNYWVTAISAQSSDMSPWLFAGYPAVVFAQGGIQLWTAIGLVVFMFLTWQYLAPAIRQETEKYKALTLWTYLEHRYNDHSGTIRLISALFAIVFLIFYIASGLVGLGNVVAPLMNISYPASVLISIIATVIYLFVGGFLAAAWSNLFQGLFLLAVVVFVPVVGFMKLGWQIAPIIEMAHTNGINLAPIPSISATVHALLLALGWGLGYFGQPHIIVNFMAIDDVKNIVYAKWVGIVWQIIAFSAAICIGLVGIGLYGGTLTNSDHLFATMVNDLLSPFLIGLVLCGVFSAALSSIVSQLLVAAASVSEDMYKKFVAPHAGSHQLMWVSRFAILLVGIISTTIALFNTASIFKLVYYAWAGLGAAFGPLLLLSLHTKLVNKYGALAAIIVGGCTALAWPFINETIPQLVAGFVLSGIAAISVSFGTNK